MTDTFFWYDLETTGTDSQLDRIVQFAGQRTDAALNPIVLNTKKNLNIQEKK